MKALAVIALAGWAVLAGCASTPTPSPGTPDERCKETSQQEIQALFARWNQSLQTGDPQAVVANYAVRSILLPTLSNRPRTTQEGKVQYFEGFLRDRPRGTINLSFVVLGCNSAVDAGIYTFKFEATGKEIEARYSYSYTYFWESETWLITSHHSSEMPEAVPPPSTSH